MFDEQVILRAFGGVSSRRLRHNLLVAPESQMYQVIFATRLPAVLPTGTVDGEQRVRQGVMGVLRLLPLWQAAKQRI